MLLYAISRFIIEFYRNDPRGIGPDVLDIAVHLASILAPLAVVMLVVTLAAGKRAAPNAARKAA